MKQSRLDRYRAKLNHLHKFHQWLTEWLAECSLETLEQTQDYRSLMGIYHTAQNAAEVVIDILAMMNKDLLQLVQDNYQNLENLVSENLISPDLKQGLYALIGLRNRLAHDYNGIIDHVAWNSIQHNLTYINQFYQVIDTWIKTQI